MDSRAVEEGALERGDVETIRSRPILHYYGHFFGRSEIIRMALHAAKAE